MIIEKDELQMINLEAVPMLALGRFGQRGGG